MEPHSLKLTIKLKREKSVSNSLETTDHSSKAEGEHNASNPCSLADNTQNQVDVSSAGALEYHSRQDDGKQPLGNSQCEVVLFNPRANGSGEAETPDPISDRPPSAAPRQHPRALPSVGAFTVQCANCFKWRLIPTQEKYEEIREHIIEQPFFCGNGKDWRPDISCDDPPDLVQDGSRLWAIDKPSIAQPPPGWQRLLKFRGEGSSKFADVYTSLVPEILKHLSYMDEMLSAMFVARGRLQLPMVSSLVPPKVDSPGSQGCVLSW